MENENPIGTLSVTEVHEVAEEEFKGLVALYVELCHPHIASYPGIVELEDRIKRRIPTQQSVPSGTPQ